MPVPPVAPLESAHVWIPGPLEASAYTSIRGDGALTMKPVVFTRVRPGQTLLNHAA